MLRLTLTIVFIIILQMAMNIIVADKRIDQIEGISKQTNDLRNFTLKKLQRPKQFNFQTIRKKSTKSKLVPKWKILKNFDPGK